jgi:transcriptional regulator with XRE-family HTH domain
LANFALFSAHPFDSSCHGRFSAHSSPRRIFLSNFPFMLRVLSNLQVEQELGRRLRRRRLDLNISQTALAEKCGIARRTITAIENGEGSTLSTLIAILRGLDSLHEWEDFLADPGPSPILLAKLQEAPRKYASKPRKAPPATEWKWGDEK